MRDGTPWEGWAQLDGLLSGPLLGADAAATLKSGLAMTPSPWLRSTLDLDGGRFHILLDDAPFEVPPAPGEDLASQVVAHLASVLAAAEVEPSACESTLRLRRWSPGREEQTLFVPASDGLQALTREVEVATLAPPAVARWSRWRRWIELLALAGAACLAWLFLRPQAAVQWSDVEVDWGSYAGLVVVDESATAAVLRPALSPEELRAALLDEEPGAPRTFAIEDVLRGRVHLRCYDDRGQVLAPEWIAVPVRADQATAAPELPIGCSRVEVVP